MTINDVKKLLKAIHRENAIAKSNGKAIKGVWTIVNGGKKS